jgi:hypothetical protein
VTEPLVIRGHHIYKYIRLTRSENPDTPESLAFDTARSVWKQFESPHVRERRYAADTMGTPNRREVYREQLQKLFERYWTQR